MSAYFLLLKSPNILNSCREVRNQTSSGSPTWIAGTHVLELLCAVTQGAF